MIIPMPGYVVIEPSKEEETTMSGLIMPDNAKDRPIKGVVVAASAVLPVMEHNVVVMGDNVSWNSELSKIKPGVTVLYRKWGGEEIKDKGKGYRIVKYGDVMAIYE